MRDRVAAAQLPLTAYDDALVELAREVGRKVCRFSEADTLDIVEWLVQAGIHMQGKPTGWIASAYLKGNLRGRSHLDWNR